MRSLRARLLGGILLCTIAMGLGSGVWAFRWAFGEAIELQDAILLQIGALAINRLQTELPAQSGVDAEAKVVIKEIWSSTSGAENETVPPKIPRGIADGLYTISQGEGPWRVLVRTRADGSRVAIAQPTAARDEIARDSAVQAVLPFFALIPCLMLLTTVVIHYSFRPVTRLAKQLDDGKQSHHPQQLKSDDIPTELQPFINSINRLLERIAVMFDHQRRFIAHAAHELRTPITALAVQAENLKRSELPEDARNRLIVLGCGIQRSARLLEQLLALAKYEDGRTASLAVRLDDVVKSVVGDYLTPARARSIDLGFSRLETVWVRGDDTALAVMVRNLIDNAIRYSREGGRVDVSVFRGEDRAFLLVEDTGPGIADGALDDVFEPFNRGAQVESDGTGLGLSIVRRIVDNHNGTIRLENVTSSENTGLCATVTFPTI
jgi:two-component system OmpR family sensor kinase